MSSNEIELELAATIEMMDTYQRNTFYRLGITFLEIFPIGLIISLISAWIFGILLRNKEPD